MLSFSTRQAAPANEGCGAQPGGHLLHERDFCSEVLQLREGDRLFSSSRLPFAYGLGNSFTFPLLNGFTTVLCREKPARKSSVAFFGNTGPRSFSVCRWLQHAP